LARPDTRAPDPRSFIIDQDFTLDEGRQAEIVDTRAHAKAKSCGFDGKALLFFVYSAISDTQ